MPDHAPDATHEEAFVADHVRVALEPLTTALGPALKVTVGGGVETVTVADCVALPPGPEHLRE